MPEEKDRLDHLLDEALSDYGRFEPRPGLEGRLLAALRQPRPLPFWRALVSGPARLAFASAAVVAVAAAVLLLARSGDEPASATRIAALPTPRAAGTAPLAPALPAAAPAAPSAAPDVAVAGPAASVVPARSGPRPAARRPVPRRRTFPAASPLGEQEQLLLRYLAEAPREEVEQRVGFLDTPARSPFPETPTGT